MLKNENRKAKLNRDGRKGLMINFFLLVISLPLLLISAGTINWINGWVYFGLTLGYEIIYTLILLKINPGLLNERGKIIREETKTFDKFYAALYLPLSYLILVISGLDAVRFQWSTMPLWIIILSIFIMVFAFYIALQAIVVNSYFECTVFVQKDQQVIQSGPYKFVRHPAYAAAILSILGSPLVLGSWLGLVPSILLVMILVIRTALEDRITRRVTRL